jgi:demethylmenaquinone methyltransferase/2-methoxy-6-polyprenyl-1,4-benzoquinol methylase
MAPGSTKLDVVYRFFTGTGFSYDRVVNLWTCGFDRYWKNRIIALLPPAAGNILDQACGTGILTLKIARAFPGARITGVELRDEYLDFARNKAQKEGMGNVRFLLGRAEEVAPEGTFDCITSSYLAKYADLEPLLANARKMLRPGGLILLHDFTYPGNPLFLGLWKIWFHLMRTIGGRHFPEWQTVFHELPGFLKETHWVADTMGLLHELGFEDIACRSLTFGTSAIVMARRGGPLYPPLGQGDR